MWSWVANDHGNFREKRGKRKPASKILGKKGFSPGGLYGLNGGKPQAPPREWITQERKGTEVQSRPAYKSQRTEKRRAKKKHWRPRDYEKD